MEFYALRNGSVKSSTSKRVDGDVSFRIQVRLAKLQDNTTYELRTVCYSVDGKTKSIEKHSVKTFTKTPNDPSNDTPTTPTPNTAPTAIDGSVNGGSAASKTFSMADVISDTEDPDSALTIIVTTPPA